MQRSSPYADLRYLPSAPPPPPPSVAATAAAATPSFTLVPNVLTRSGHGEERSAPRFFATLGIVFTLLVIGCLVIGCLYANSAWPDMSNSARAGLVLVAVGIGVSSLIVAGWLGAYFRRCTPPRATGEGRGGAWDVYTYHPPSSVA